MARYVHPHFQRNSNDAARSRATTTPRPSTRRPARESAKAVETEIERYAAAKGKAAGGKAW